MASSAFAEGIFNIGPPAKLETLAGLMNARHPNIALRAIGVICIGWLPLALIAAPLLIVADGLCAPRLSAVAMSFQSARLISPTDEPRFLSIVRSTLRLRDSTRLETALGALVAVLVLLIALRVPLGELAG